MDAVLMPRLASSNTYCIHSWATQKRCIVLAVCAAFWARIKNHCHCRLCRLGQRWTKALQRGVLLAWIRWQCNATQLQKLPFTSPIISEGWRWHWIWQQKVKHESSTYIGWLAVGDTLHRAPASWQRHCVCFRLPSLAKCFHAVYLLLWRWAGVAFSLIEHPPNKQCTWQVRSGTQPWPIAQRCWIKHRRPVRDISRERWIYSCFRLSLQSHWEVREPGADDDDDDDDENY